MTVTIESFMGLKLIVDPALDNVPRMQLKHEFAKLMPPEFVEQTNKWLREFFGTESAVYTFDNGWTIALGQKACAKIKATQHA